MVKLTRLFEILENTAKHLNNKHGARPFEDWDVSVTPTRNGLEINMRGPSWRQHIKAIDAALENAETKNDHDF